MTAPALLEPVLDAVEALERAAAPGRFTPGPSSGLASALCAVAIDEDADPGLVDLHAVIGTVVGLTHGACQGLATLEMDLAADEPVVQASARDLTLALAFVLLDAARSIAEGRAAVQTPDARRLRIQTLRRDVGIDVVVESSSIRHVVQVLPA